MATPGSAALDPLEVATRLATLRSISRIEADDEARARLLGDQPVKPLPFDAAVHRRLRELHALCALANHLHRAGRPSR